jgi:hypothetical protein
MLILKLSWRYNLLLCPVHTGPIYASQSGVEDVFWLPIIICLLFSWLLNFCGVRPMCFGLEVSIRITLSLQYKYKQFNALWYYQTLPSC